jgi:hypothetical protein
MNDNKGSNTENTNASECVADPCATVTTQVKPVADQAHVFPTVIGAGPVYLKLPVLLAETNITIPVEATITLDRNVKEIKRIKKNVYLTQSRLIPNFPTATPPTTAILFIEGFIRKNIEYATQDCTTAGTQNFCGDIRHCTVEVPFSFTTVIDVLRATPIFNPNTNPQELEFFTDKLQGCDICADPVLGRNPCDQSFQFTEIFNEKPYVELESAVVTEVDIHTNPTFRCETPTEQSFTQLTEKVVINLTLKVLQNQQVRVQSLG